MVSRRTFPRTPTKEVLKLDLNPLCTTPVGPQDKAETEDGNSSRSGDDCVRHPLIGGAYTT
jgi:hypothetical protein